MQLRYYGRDIDAIRSKLIESIRRVEPSLTQFTGSDPGTMLIDAVSEVADSLNYYIDRRRLESYISTCRQNDSLLNLATLSSYFIRGVQPPTVEVELTSSVAMSFRRKQIEINGSPYVINSQVIIDQSNGMKTSTIAYNGTTKTIWKNTSQLDKFDPRIKIDKSEKVPAQCMEVYLEFEDNTVLLSRRSWFPILRKDGYVEVAIRDNRIKLATAKNIIINYIEIESSNFAPLPAGATSTIDGIVFRTLSESTSGSSAETYEESRRNIVGNNMLMDSIVSVIDFETVAMEDLEVRRSKAFDINTPSIVTGIDNCKVYVDLKDDTISALPNSVNIRLSESFRDRTMILGVTPEILLAPKKKFNLSVKVFTYAPEMIEYDVIREAIIDKYRDTEFAQRISPGDISSTIKELDQFIEYVEVVAPTTPITPNVNEVPKLDTLTLSIELVK